MKSNGCSLSILLAFALLPSTGCRTTSLSHYQPSDPPVYAVTRNQTADLRPVVDRRSDYEPSVYFRHYRDHARFDRSIAVIVGEAVRAELLRAGLQVDRPSPDVLLECELHDFSAVVTETEFKPSTLDLSLKIRFRWLDANTTRVLEENVRQMNRHRILGSSETVALPFDAEQVRDFGRELLNEMLPRLIEKELGPWLNSNALVRTQ